MQTSSLPLQAAVGAALVPGSPSPGSGRQVPGFFIGIPYQ
jgi:hypothetical protein